jgi:alkanesulfonate monooxygenase SsuD/methylene tetrahydromethanopterin reductase-like flavin-dependent oxidoreductase (luciferase family)
MDRATAAPRFAGIGLWLEPPPEDPGAPGPGLLDQAAEAAGAADRAGVGTLWVGESAGPAGLGTPYEAYSLLGALGVRSNRLRLGVVAAAGERRPPSILAKIVTGVDVISHGRAVLALDGDCGVAADAERLSEALTVVRSVLADDHPTFAGRIYSIDDAVNRPAPVQPGGVPVVVFLHGSGPGTAPLLDVAARLADAVVVDGRGATVEAACRAVSTRADADDRPGGPVEVLGRLGAGLTPDTVGTSVAAVRDAGATGCVVGLAHPWDPGWVEGLARSW